MKCWIYYAVRPQVVVNLEYLSQLPRAGKDAGGNLQSEGVLHPDFFSDYNLPQNLPWTRIIGDWVLFRVLFTRDEKIHDVSQEIIGELIQIGFPKDQYNPNEEKTVYVNHTLLLALNTKRHWLVVTGFYRTEEELRNKTETFFVKHFSPLNVLRYTALSPAEIDMHDLCQTLRENHLVITGISVDDSEDGQFIRVRNEFQVIQSKVVLEALKRAKEGKWKGIEFKHPRGWYIKIYQRNQNFLTIEVPNWSEETLIAALDLFLPIIGSKIGTSAQSRLLL